VWRFARDDFVFRGRTGGRKKRSPSPPIAELQLTGIAKDLHELLKETGIWDMPTAPHKFEYDFGVRLHDKNVRPLVDSFILPNAQRVFLFPEGPGGCAGSSCGHDMMYVVGRCPRTTALRALVQDLVRQRDTLISQLRPHAGAQQTEADARSYGTPLLSPHTHKTRVEYGAVHLPCVSCRTVDRKRGADGSGGGPARVHVSVEQRGSGCVRGCWARGGFYDKLASER